MAKHMRTRRKVSRKSARKATGKRRVGRRSGKSKKVMRVLCPMNAKSCTITCKFNKKK